MHALLHQLHNVARGDVKMYPPAIGEIQDLQKTADYNLVHKSRNMGIGSIAWGAINAIVALLFFSNDVLSWGVLLLGFSLIAEGIWISIKPSPKGFLVDGIFLLILGIWNLVVSINDYILWNQYVNRNPLYYVPIPSPAFIIIGISQIGWCIMRIRRYSRFSNVSSEKPDLPISSRVDEIMESVKKAKPTEAYDLIEFTGSGTNWKGKLLGEIAVLVGVSGLLRKSVNDAAFVRREDMYIVDKGRYRLSRFRKIQVRMGTRNFNGLMTQQSMQRYEQVWKTASSTPPPPPTD